MLSAGIRLELNISSVCTVYISLHVSLFTGFGVLWFFYFSAV